MFALFSRNMAIIDVPRRRKGRGRASLFAVMATTTLAFAAFGAAILALRGDESSFGGSDARRPGATRETCRASVDWEAMKIDPKRGLASVFTPYDILFGGGERYLLAAVAALQADGYFVHVLVERGNACDSTAHLLRVAEGLRVDLDPDRVALKIVVKDHRTRKLRVPSDVYSAFFELGNEKAPLAHGIGHVNFYMCQFPFDLDRAIEDADVSALASYDYVLLNSRFSAMYYDYFASDLLRRAIGEFGSAPQVEVLNPPVAPFGRGDPDAPERTGIVLLGRFFEGRQSKGHATAIETFRSIRADLPEGTELRFVGKLMPGQEGYLSDLRERAKGLPVAFEVDAPSSVVGDALRTSLVQWHMTGGDSDTADDPASEEHFGISVAEGQSAGVIPVVLDRGGLRDVVEQGEDGFLERTPAEVGTRTVAVFGMKPLERRALSDRAVERSARFSDTRFAASFAKLTQRGKLTKPFRHLIAETRGEVLSREFVLPKGAKKALVLIEPRQHYALEYVVKNALYHLPGWGLYVFHSHDNEDFVRAALSGVENVEFRRMDTHSLAIADLNRMLLDPRFWDEVHADKALLFQTDSLFVRGGVEEFERFDYVGAPWARDNERTGLLGSLVPPGAGNGGLSLRSVRKMREITRRLRVRPTGREQEDLAFSLALGFDDSSTMPTRETAYKFAAEVPCSDLENGDVEKVGKDYPMALHAAWYYWSGDERRFADLLGMLETSVCGV